FNGLVRHSYLRDKPHQGELQVNLAPKGKRERNSHAVALEVRGRLAGLALPEGGALKVVEVPPGPPVLATLLAEIYGPDAASRRAGAQEVRRAFAAVDFIVDIDDTLRAPGERVRFAIDRENLEFHRVEEVAVYDTLATLLAGRAVGYSHRGAGIHPIEIAVRLPRGALVPGERLLTTPVPTLTGGTVELGEVLRVGREPASPSIFRRDGRFAEMVMADLAGRYEAPIYGMLAVEDVLARAGSGLALRYHGQPEDESRPTLLWDGEWEITYVTFRDMGAAFIAAILGIYLLVVGQFRSFRLPLLVLLPVPLTLPGIVLGHWLTGAAFTATSMIGFIALAGIVVRNSILLIDFVQARRAAGDDATRAGLAAGAVRIKPILLTALAAMIGAAFILADPIFQGLAVSLLFGLASSTVLTVLAVPAAYAWLRGAALTAP
ncbi:MAG: efflux RND transporter permease subunit, partial [Alphaproteobacteria bacterium]|nr:efflux RND transporter permease subunit [Alphaproteobacteria bacterium]